MREALALVRASWLTAISYRVSMAVSLLSLAATVIPIYFIANALQPTMAASIQSQGEHYFAFLLVGLISFSFIATAVHTLPRAIQSGIGSGTFEALLSTPARLPALLSGLLGYDFVWTAVRALALLLVGIALGATLAWGQLLTATGILALIILAHLPFGLIAAALVLLFRTSARVPQGILMASGLLGGVYYPTQVIPSWIQHLSDVLPLTYGLRALRQTVLEGMSLRAVAPDVGILCAFAVTLLLLGSSFFAYALRHSKKTGTLTQY